MDCHQVLLVGERELLQSISLRRMILVSPDRCDWKKIHFNLSLNVKEGSD